MADQVQTRHETILDDSTRHIARVYAEALLNAAQRRQQDAAVLEDLEALVGQVFARDPAFEQFLASAAIGRDRKAAILRRAFEGHSDELLVNFLLVLNERDRLDLLRAVVVAYRALYDRRAGRMHVQVASAVPLAADQEERLRQELRAKFNREPVLHTRVDPDLLGGLLVRVGDFVYDGSVRARLETIRNQLIERSSYEIQSGRNRIRTRA